MAKRDSADLVVVGAGTIGGWASVFAKELGAERVVVLEKGEAGQGASSRAAGIVRAQGGTPETVAPRDVVDRLLSVACRSATGPTAASASSAT